MPDRASDQLEWSGDGAAPNTGNLSVTTFNIIKRLLAATFVLALGGACATAPAAVPTPPAATPSPDAPSDPEPVRPVPAELAGHWTDEFTVGPGGGWTLGACEGDAPDICVFRDGELVGNLELAEYPIDEPSGAPLEIAEGRAESFLEFFADDRAKGCADFEFVADPIEEVAVGGVPGVKTGFRLVAQDGTVVERVINHFVVHDGVLFLVNTDAYVTDGGCLDPSETALEFEPDVLAEFEEHVDRIIADTLLPDATLPV